MLLKHCNALLYISSFSQEEEIRRAEEERLKKEDEEAEKWMSMISVDKEGTGALGHAFYYRIPAGYTHHLAPSACP
jgi:hypothetical protein